MAIVVDHHGIELSVHWTTYGSRSEIGCCLLYDNDSGDLEYGDLYFRGTDAKQALKDILNIDGHGYYIRPSNVKMEQDNVDEDPVFFRTDDLERIRKVLDDANLELNHPNHWDFKVMQTQTKAYPRIQHV